MRFIKSADLEQLQFAAMSFKKTQHYSLAEDAYRQLIALEEGLFGPESSSVALNLYNLAEVVVHQQKFDEARNLLRRAVEIWEHAHPNDYLSLLSYTEALSSVKRYESRSRDALNNHTTSADACQVLGDEAAMTPATPAVAISETAISETAISDATKSDVTVSLNVIPLRRLGTHVA